MSAVIDFDSINETIFASRDYKLKSRELSERYIGQALSSHKRELLERFDNHSITQELEAGPGSSNISGTLGGYGDLFSFIGFRGSAKPTEQLRRLLESISYLEPAYINNKWVFTIPLPDKKSIIFATPIPWQPGAGWAIEVEKGISGLGRFLSIARSGRSGGGIEVEKVIRQASESTRMGYITPMLERFRVDFERVRL